MKRNAPGYWYHKASKTWRKCCKICTGPLAEGLSHLPFFAPIIEDEHHILVACPKYHHIRMGLDENIKSSLVSWETERVKELFSSDRVFETARFISKLLKIRFPHKEEDAGSTKKCKKKKDTGKKKSSKKNSCNDS